MIVHPPTGPEHERARPGVSLGQMSRYFLRLGARGFGGPVVLAHHMRRDRVEQRNWLTDRQFIDAVPIGMISPGPVVITATFVDHVLNGLWGAFAATVAMFAPSVLLTIVAAPLLERYRDNRHLQGFPRGIVTAGAMLGLAGYLRLHPAWP